MCDSIFWGDWILIKSLPPLSKITGFGEFFSNIGPQLDTTIPTDTRDPLDFLGGAFPHSFFVFPSDDLEVTRCINSFKLKGSQLNEIPIYIYKRLSQILSPIISKLFNKSIYLGKFPKILKKSRIVPIPKVNSSTNVNDYRPISIIPILSKIFEKLINVRLISYLNKFDLLVPFQFGFREGSSTNDALLQFLDTIYEGLDGGSHALALFLDLKKAFDTVNHAILLRKMYAYGVRGSIFSWVQSY